MSLPALLAPMFRARSGAVALEWACQEYTFGGLDARANRMARELTARGLGAGDRLALWLPNRLEYVDLYLACTRLGIIVVPINVLYRERERAHILADSTPRAVVVEDPGAWDVPGIDAWSVDALAAAAAVQPAHAPDVAVTGGTPAALVYTSGTTGPAKGAVITHANLAANARTLVDAWRFSASDRLLLALPLFHVHGLGNGVHCWLLSGCRARLLARFDQASAAATFLDFQPTVFFGVPTMFVRLLDVDPGQARRIGLALRLCVSGSAPLPAQVLHDFEKLYGQRILERYGMTETLMTLSNPYDGERRAGTVGLPLPGVSVRIVDGNGAPVADMEDGELLVQSPTVCDGYWNRPRRDGGRVDRRVVQDRRHRASCAGRVHHAAGPARRRHHLGRLQHLSAGDRGASGRASGGGRSVGCRHARSGAWRGAGRLRRAVRGRLGRGRGAGRVLPRPSGVVQDTAADRVRGAAAEDGAGKGAEAGAEADAGRRGGLRNSRIWLPAVQPSRPCRASPWPARR